MMVTISGKLAVMSRGRITAKNTKTGEWARRGNGTVIIESPGSYMISQTDGFARKETCYVEVSEDGKISGLGSKMYLA